MPDGGTIFARHASFSENQIYQGLAGGLFLPLPVLIPTRTRLLVGSASSSDVLAALDRNCTIDYRLRKFSGPYDSGHCDPLDGFELRTDFPILPGYFEVATPLKCLLPVRYADAIFAICVPINLKARHYSGEEVSGKAVKIADNLFTCE